MLPAVLAEFHECRRNARGFGIGRYDDRESTQWDYYNGDLPVSASLLDGWSDRHLRGPALGSHVKGVVPNLRMRLPAINGNPLSLLQHEQACFPVRIVR